MSQSLEAPKEGLHFLTLSFEPSRGEAASVDLTSWWALSNSFLAGFLIHSLSVTLYPAFPAGRLSCRISLWETSLFRSPQDKYPCQDGGSPGMH